MKIGVVNKVKRLAAFALTMVLCFNLSVPMGLVVSKAEGELGAISNQEALFEAEGGGISVARERAEGNDRAIHISVGGYNPGEDGKGIASIRYNNTEYYYKGENITSSTTAAGVYYSDGSSMPAGWYFVYPTEDRSGDISVQVALSTYIKKDFSVTDSSYSGGELSAATVAALQAAVPTDNVSIRYLKHDATISSYDIAVSPGNTYNLSTIGSKVLSFKYDSESDGVYKLKVYYGNILCNNHYAYVYTKDGLTVSPAFANNSNAVKVNASVSGADEYIAILEWRGFESETPENFVFLKASQRIKTNNSGNEIENADYYVKAPASGLLVAGSGAMKGQNPVVANVKAEYGAYKSGYSVAKDSASPAFKWYGPGSITYKNLKVGDEVGVDDASEFKDKNSSSKAKGSRILGEIISVNGKSLSSGSFSDDYVTIKANGDIKVKKSGTPSKYTLVTATKYNIMQYDDVKKAIFYKTSSGMSTDPSGAILGTQEWEVSLNLGSIANSSGKVETTTTAVATTTEAVTTTEAATTTTEAATTAVTATTAAGATTAQGATTAANATTAATATTESSKASATTEVPIDESMPTVSNVNVTAKKLKLNVSWEQVADVDGYIVYVSANNKLYERAAVLTSAKNSYTVTKFNGKKLKKNKKYYVKVQAFKGAPSIVKKAKKFKAKCKKKGKLSIKLNGQYVDPSVRSVTVYISTKKKSGYKKVGKIVNTMRSSYTLTAKKYKKKKVKKGKKYFVKVVKNVDVTDKTYGQYSEVKMITCKK